MSVYLRYNVQWVSIYIHIYTFVIMREIDLQREAQPQLLMLCSLHSIIMCISIYTDLDKYSCLHLYSGVIPYIIIYTKLMIIDAHPQCGQRNRAVLAPLDIYINIFIHISTYIQYQITCTVYSARRCIQDTCMSMVDIDIRCLCIYMCIQ